MIVPESSTRVPCVSDTQSDTSTPQGTVPRNVGRKFHANGQVRPFAGSTIIAHLPQQDRGFATFDAFLDIYRELPGHVFTPKLALLPTSSYHMTIFSGPTDQDRDRSPWPADLDKSAPIEACTRLMAERLKGFRLDCALPLRMRIDTAYASGNVSPVTIHLQPLDAQEAHKLRHLRDRLADTLNIRTADHDAYRFHITIAYQIAWFTSDEQEAFRRALEAWRGRLFRSCPVIEFGAPEFCVFRDMFAFQTLFRLTD